MACRGTKKTILASITAAAKLRGLTGVSIMSLSIEHLAGSIPAATSNQYLPYPVAVEAGELKDPKNLAEQLDTPAGVILASGHIPNVHQAGLVADHDRLIVFDHATLSVEGDKIRIQPRSKSDVDSSDDGKIKEEGVIFMMDIERTPDLDLIRYVALAIDRVRRPLALRNIGRQSIWHTANDPIAMVNLSYFDAQEHEITDIDLASGSMLAKRRTRYL
jgi:hypothetical protein